MIKYGVMRPSYFNEYKTERKGMAHAVGNIAGGSVIKPSKKHKVELTQ